MCIFFLFKQKTAYEMRISDWSSDVCSSDLDVPCGQRRRDRFGERLAGDALIPHAQPPRVRREADVVARPVMAHERCDEPAILLRDVAVDKGPDMIAADRPRLDQS